MTVKYKFAAFPKIEIKSIKTELGSTTNLIKHLPCLDQNSMRMFDIFFNPN